MEAFIKISVFSLMSVPSNLDSAIGKIRKEIDDRDQGELGNMVAAALLVALNKSTEGNDGMSEHFVHRHIHSKNIPQAKPTKSSRMSRLSHQGRTWLGRQ